MPISYVYNCQKERGDTPKMESSSAEMNILHLATLVYSLEYSLFLDRTGKIC